MAAAARTTTTSGRRRPLQTCAASMSGIIDTAYKRSGYLGNFTKHLTTLATSTIPFASTMQNLGRTMISLTDDHILFLERVTESVFPPAGRVFDKIDELVYSVVEELPHRNPIESPKKTDSSSEEAQEKFMLSSTGEFTESPDIAIESENFDEALGQSMVSSNKFAESADKENLDEALGESMVSEELVENLDEALGESMVSEELVESTDKEDVDEGRSPSMVSSTNKLAESTDEENRDEALSPSMVSTNELVESAKTENYAETQEQSMLGMRNDEEKSVSKKTTETEEAEKKNEQLLDTKEFEKEPPLSPTESFLSAQYEYITSSSAAGGDSFLDDEPFEHVELPMISTDEDENNDNFVPVSIPGNEKSVDHSSDHSPRPVAAIASSSSKNKARKKKAIRKDEKKNENEGEDQHKILELLEAKWHMM